MKHLKTFENSNIDFFDKIKNSLLEIRNLEQKILDYISYTEDYNSPGFYISNDDCINIITDSNNNSRLNFRYCDGDKEEFNRFLNDPELFKNSDKYNL